MKRDALDAVFSDVIRESWDWTCARCGKQFPDRKGRDVHASHFFSRQYNSTRWFPDNCFCLCATCHDTVGKQHDQHVALAVKILGIACYEALQERRRQIYRYRAIDKKEMRKHYGDELKRLHFERRNGAKGFIPVMAYD